jgi:hypothetical protein
MTDQPTDIEEFEGLPLRFAYGFLAEKGFADASTEIKRSKDRVGSYTSTLKRGKVLNLLEKNNLLSEFIDKFWHFGSTEGGKHNIQRYKRILDSFLYSDRTEEEEEEENIDETRFAYEENLRDYLSSNLSVIEPGLTLFKDKDGIEGVEYSIDSDNKRIDILAIDKNKTPVVIELKVSRGYEKVIGQCLYYKNRVKELLGTARVRIVIIAREITPHLKLATADLPDVELFEYILAVKLKKL